jgi:DNA-binding beta-propeller fold protein YncE
MHVIPQLRVLENTYTDALVVVGVHSAKFPAERETANVREAVLRYGVAHPVVNDKDFAVWRAYGCRAWPTLIFIDPKGNVIGKHEGELLVPEFTRIVGEMVREFDADGSLVRGPMRFRLESVRESPSFLSFPGKVLVDAGRSRLFIADSNHHRIVVADTGGTVVDVIGSGELGMRDGPTTEARFSHPQGLSVAGDVLYIADTENHAIRSVDLASRMVTTIAGTGAQAHEGRRGGEATQIELSSPWDVLFTQGHLFIAMAGFHQIWTYSPATNIVEPWAGSGREDLLDGPGSDAQFAQPSGLTTDGTTLYVADSETSAVRAVDLQTRTVHALVGRGLFEFGDEDAIGEDALLQHPLGVCWWNGALFVADSYNSKLKRIDPISKACTSITGNPQGGNRDGTLAEALFREPSGISVSGELLYIADTNNHAIRVLDFPRGEVTTLRLHSNSSLGAR